MSRVVDAQDCAWWGTPDGDLDDLRHELDRVRLMTGSLDAGARVAIVGGDIVGVALSVGHGHASAAVDAAACVGAGAEVSVLRRALFAWLIETVAGGGGGVGDVGAQIESPAHDGERLADLAAVGLVPRRSSFELERPGDTSDLGAPAWPEGIRLVPFRLGVDDGELHDMLYSFWTEVPGHTFRPFDEWRSLVLAGPWFDAELVVVARRDGGDGALVGCALGRTFTGDVGWVSQLGVAPAARGLGLGRAILTEASRRLGARQPRVIGLGVEAENANALGLYRSVGFDIVREWVHCEPG